MSNIVERLRAYVKDEGGWYNILETCEEAADEIERLNIEIARLREALESLLDEQNGPPLIGSALSWQKAVDQARAALAEKEKTNG